MSVEDLLIHFSYGEDNQRQYYMPGDHLQGIVSLHLRSALKVRGIVIHFLGKGYVAWENTHKNRTYVATETYLDTGKPLLDIGYDNTISLPPGLHQFGFKYLLPTELPSTFNGVYGNITYTAQVKVDCEDERVTTVTSEPFMVLRRPELPIDIYEPKTMKKSKFFIGFKSGKIKAECTIDKSAAIPGDYISVDADVVNFSGKSISLLQAAVVLESRYYAEGRDIVFKQYLNTRDDFFDTNNRRGRRWHHVFLQIPPFLSDSGLENCNIMDIRYIFQFKVKIDGEEDILLTTPLYIGLHSSALGPGGKDLLLGRMWQGITNLEEDDDDEGPARFDIPWYGGEIEGRNDYRVHSRQPSFNENNNNMLRVGFD